MGTVETSLRPKIRPSEEEMADIEAGRTIKRANRLKKLIEKEAEGLLDRTPLTPIKPPTGKPVIFEMWAFPEEDANKKQFTTSINRVLSSLKS